MGGSSSSTGAVAVSQDEGNVATISEDVARRLLGLSDEKRGSRSTSDDQQRKVTYKSQPTTSQEDLDFLEGHYMRRIHSLEKQNEILQRSNDAEFSAAVKEVEDKFIKHRFTDPICCELQQAVERCYTNNPGSPLACVEQVKAFKACVQQHRKTMFSTKG